MTDILPEIDPWRPMDENDEFGAAMDLLGGRGLYAARRWLGRGRRLPTFTTDKPGPEHAGCVAYHRDGDRIEPGVLYLGATGLLRFHGIRTDKMPGEFMIFPKPEVAP